MKTEVIRIHCYHEPPFEREDFMGPIRAEIFGPFGVHASVKKKGEFTISYVPAGARIYSDDFSTIEEARRVAKRLNTVNPWFFQNSHAVDSSWRRTMLRAMTDEGFKDPKLKDIREAARRTFTPEEIEDYNKAARARRY